MLNYARIRSASAVKHCRPLSAFSFLPQLSSSMAFSPVATKTAKLFQLWSYSRSSCPSRSKFVTYHFSTSLANSDTRLKPAQFATSRSWFPKTRNVQWIFLGCPGVGKGTYASRLSNLLGVPHIATGDLVREELNSSGPLVSQLKDTVNQGKLVPDEVIIRLLSKHLETGTIKNRSGFILDGFPRTLRQAEILEGLIDTDLVINLKLREEALLAKCLGRRICSECGANYNIARIDIKDEEGRPGMCMAPLPPPPRCATKLIQRPDDTEDVVKERLRVYNELSKPVEEFYRSRGKLLEFDLPGGIPESWPKLLQALNLDDRDEKKFAAA